MNLTTLSLADLRDLDAKIATQIARGEAKRREAAIEQIYAVAHSLGLPLQSLLNGDREQSANTRPQRQRYQNPSDPSNTWAGVGPRPDWLKKALAAGVPIDSLRA